jgi:hypothetical protein
MRDNHFEACDVSLKMPDLTTEQPFMSNNHGVSGNPESRIENFAAELTSAAYALALQDGLRGSWIKVELDLWKALAQTVKKWARERPPAWRPEEFKAWREGLLVDLTETAFYVAVKHGINGPLLGVELGLYRAFRLVIRRRYSGVSRVSLVGQDSDPVRTGSESCPTGENETAAAYGAWQSV